MTCQFSPYRCKIMWIINNDIIIKKTKRSSFVGYAPGQASKASSQRKSNKPETTFWKRRKGWGRHFTITTTTCFDWWKFPQTQTRVIQSDIYVPKCWVDLSFNSRVILDFLVLKLSFFGSKSRTISSMNVAAF